MPKRHLQNLAEQIVKKGYGSAPFHNEKNPNLSSGGVKLEDSPAKADEVDSSLKGNGKAVARLINEGDPNAQE